MAGVVYKARNIEAAIAATILSLGLEEKAHVVTVAAFADMLGESNERFNRERFIMETTSQSRIFERESEIHGLHAEHGHWKQSEESK